MSIYSYLVAWPPENAYLLILVLIYSIESVKNIALFSSDELILELKPYNAGKNLLYIHTGLFICSFEVKSQVILKYGSWSIPIGMIHNLSVLVPNICGKHDEITGAAWKAG